MTSHPHSNSNLQLLHLSWCRTLEFWPRGLSFLFWWEDMFSFLWLVHLSAYTFSLRLSCLAGTSRDQYYKTDFALTKLMATFWCIIFQKLGQPRALFHLFCLFKHTSLHFIKQRNVKNVMSIQYTVPGFELTTFRTSVSSHNHYTRAPAHLMHYLKAKWVQNSTFLHLLCT